MKFVKSFPVETGRKLNVHKTFRGIALAKCNKSVDAYRTVIKYKQIQSQVFV